VEGALQAGREAELGDVVDAAADLLRTYRRNPLLVFDGVSRPQEN
jgi:hypothetical protein